MKKLSLTSTTISAAIGILAVAALTLALNVSAHAHGNEQHVMGTVTEVTDHSVSVKIADGTIKTVEFDAQTKFLKGTDAITSKEVTVGSRVVIHAKKQKDTLLATEVKIGTAAAATTH